jgi:hypothetical protein
VTYGSDGGIVSSLNSFERSSLAAATPGKLFKLLFFVSAAGTLPETHQPTFFRQNAQRYHR